MPAHPTAAATVTTLPEAGRITATPLPEWGATTLTPPPARSTVSHTPVPQRWLLTFVFPARYIARLVDAKRRASEGKAKADKEHK